MTKSRLSGVDIGRVVKHICYFLIALLLLAVSQNCSCGGDTTVSDSTFYGGNLAGDIENPYGAASGGGSCAGGGRINGVYCSASADGTAILSIREDDESYQILVTDELNQCDSEVDLLTFGETVESGYFFSVDDTSLRFVIDNGGDAELGRVTYDYTGSLGSITICRPRDQEGEASRLVPIRYQKLR